jgi:hypothetical protein
MDAPEDLEPVIRWPGNEIAASGLFEAVAVRRYPWTERYTAERHAKLVQIYSDHLALPAAALARLAGRIKALIGELGGTIDRPYVSVLYVAKRR